MRLPAIVTMILSAGVTVAPSLHAAAAASVSPSVTASGASAVPASPSLAAAASSGAPVPPSAVAPGYVIGPGDTLQVFVWRNAELTTTVPVRPDGKISTPLVEDMVAIGKTPTQLAGDIEKVLSEYVKSPQVSVIVTQAVSVYSQIKVTGQVLHPQALPYREGMTVLDAVLAVGGMSQFASGNRAKVVRSENGRQTEIKVRLINLVNKGDMSQNVALKPGDVLVVPESSF